MRGIRSDDFVAYVCDLLAPLGTVRAKAMFGGGQMRWLRDGLAQSKAAFKVVCSGSQLLSQNANGVTSGWHSYEGERGPFLAWLAKSGIPGVIFLSGRPAQHAGIPARPRGAGPGARILVLAAHLVALRALRSRAGQPAPAGAAGGREAQLRHPRIRPAGRQAGGDGALLRFAIGEPLWTQVLATVGSGKPSVFSF